MTEQQNDGTGMSEAELQAHEEAKELVMRAVAEGVTFVSGYLPEAITSKQEYQDQIDVVIMRQIERQPKLLQVYEDMLDPVNRAKYPRVRAIIHGPAAAMGQDTMEAHMQVEGVPPGRRVLAMIDAPKKMPDGVLLDIPAIGQLATFLGFLTSPPLRALLVVHGLDISFQQTAVKKPSSIIV